MAVKKHYMCDDCGYECDLTDDEYDGVCPSCHEHHGFYEVDESLTEDKNETLNQAIWDENNELKPAVREKLELIANKFIDTLKEQDIPLDVKDIIIVGSNANYNYTQYSDIDLHIVADLSQFQGREKELADKLYQAKKTIFNGKYDPVINGFDVEIYVEPAEDTNMNEIPDEIEREENIDTIEEEPVVKEALTEDAYPAELATSKAADAETMLVQNAIRFRNKGLSPEETLTKLSEYIDRRKKEANRDGSTYHGLTGNDFDLGLKRMLFRRNEPLDPSKYYAVMELPVNLPFEDLMRPWNYSETKVFDTLEDAKKYIDNQDLGPDEQYEIYDGTGNYIDTFDESLTDTMESLNEAINFDTIFDSAGFEQNVLSKIPFTAPNINDISTSEFRKVKNYISSKFNNIKEQIDELESDGNSKKEIISILEDDLDELGIGHYGIITLATIVYETIKYIDKNYFDESLTEDVNEEEAECEWCGDMVPINELHETDQGYLCDYCIQAIKSRGEPITLYEKAPVDDEWEFETEEDMRVVNCPKCEDQLTFVGWQGDTEEYKCPVCGRYFYYENGKLLSSDEFEANYSTITEDYLEDNDIDDFQLLDKLQILAAQAPGKCPEAEAFLTEFETKVSELGDAQAALEELDVSAYDLLDFINSYN